NIRINIFIMDPIYSDEMREKEIKLLRKIDLKIVPFLFLLYLLSFLDRVNIGNAKLANIERDLGLVGRAFEAGLVPGIVYYITMWYKRFEQSSRMGIILSGASIAGAFSGLLTYAIVSLTNDNSPLKGWQLIFLIDGLVTIIVAIFAFFHIADYPEKAKWLRKEERSLSVLRLKHDAGGVDYQKHTFDKVYILECLKDWKVYISMLILLGINTAVYSFAFFVPSIVNGFGFNEVISQLLVAPPFCLGCISILTVSALSDRINVRGPFVMSLTNNLSPPLKCNIGVAMMISGGNMGGLIAAQIYRSADYPNYVPGHVIASGCLLAAICLCAIQYGILNRLNEQKKEKSIKIKASSYADDEDKKELDDRNHKFIYSL
ncbi:11467_t:CDS:2, partial [Dentiscutata erythropus]